MKKVMKNIIKYFAVAIVTVMAFQSCGDDEPMIPNKPEEPKEEVYTYNVSDSIAFCHIFTTAYNGYSGTIQIINKMWLDSIPSWHPFVSWVKDEEHKEYRISSLKINAWDTEKFYGVLSFHLVLLDSLKNLEVSGSSIHGYFPSEIGSHYALENLSIVGTNMTYIPGRVLNAPSLKYLRITQNYNLELPDFDFIQHGGQLYKTPRRYLLNDNGFKGMCKMRLEHYVNLDNNEITEVDWDYMEKVDFRQFLKENPRPGPSLRNNPIQTTIPDYILKDTLAIIYVGDVFGESRKGNIKNLPSLEEIYKMKVEWKRNHPEEAAEMHF